MPLGRFILIADFVLDTTASGVCNAHAVADFSPDTTLPAEWVRMRDPFQGVSKKVVWFQLLESRPAPPSSAAVGLADDLGASCLSRRCAGTGNAADRTGEPARRLSDAAVGRLR